MSTKRKYAKYGNNTEEIAKRRYKKKVAKRRPKDSRVASSLSAIGSAIGGVAGGLEGGIGAIPGAAIGGAVGNLLGNGITYFTGFGDYKIKKNTFLNGNKNGMIYNSANNKLGGTVFNKTEYIGDVISSGTANTFNLQTWEFNPGNPDLFPWLSQCSANWQQYIVEGAYIEYRTFSGNALNSTNTALGCVTMSSQYNCNDPDFESKQEMENYEYACSVVPSQSVCYFFECARNQNVLDNLYVNSRKNTVQSNDEPVPINDKRFENLCKFSCATSGCQGTSVNLGSLFITYQIRLLKTKLYDTLGLGNGNFRCANANYVTQSFPFGTYTPIYNNLGLIEYNNSTLNGVEFPYNTQTLDYLVIASWNADTAGIIGGGVSSVVHASPGAIISIDSVGYMLAPANGVTATKVVRAWYVRTAGNGVPLRIYMDSADAPVLPTGTNQMMYMEIIQMPKDYT